MKTTEITTGGQIQVPADVRRRWNTRKVTVEDPGGSLVVRPIPDDPIGAAVGSLAGDGPTSDEIRAQLRHEELDADRSAP